MFSSLFGKKKKKAHPLSTEAGVDDLLQSIPRDDTEFLGAVDDWLEDIPKLVNEIGLEACLRATLRFDQVSRQFVASLLRDYLAAESERHLSRSVQDILRRHTFRLCAAYSMVLCGDDASSAQTARHGNGYFGPDLLKNVGLKYFQVLSLRFRLSKFRYGKPGPEAWLQAHVMLRYFEKHSGGSNDAPLPREVREKIFREYLKVVCLALVPMSNLSPEQLEFVARMLGRAENIQCLTEPTADTSHMIDISTDLGPIPYKPDYCPVDGALLYYLSITSLQRVVQKFQEALDKKIPLPRDFADLPINRSQVAGVLSVLKTHWTNQPPNRSSDRIATIEAMRGALGFTSALKLVEISEKVRSDQPINDAHSELLNRLWQLEEKVDKRRLEDWTQVDGNDDGVGVGVSIPTIRAQHVAGSLVSMRYADEPGWHLGIVRRVGINTDGSFKLGLSTFQGAPKIVDITRSEQSIEESADWRDIRGIAFDDNVNQMLIPTGTYAEGMKINFTLDSVERTVHLVRLIESGPDFELVRFSEE